jgi:hypothetical protein
MSRTATTGRDLYFVYRPLLDLIGRKDACGMGGAGRAARCRAETIT